jgi:hypothetical protein
VNLSSLQFEEVTSEAVERIIRAKNVIIYGSVSQSVLRGAPGLRERCVGAPRPPSSAHCTPKPQSLSSQEYEKVIDLISDSAQKLIFEKHCAAEFWCILKQEYIELSKKTVSFLLPFVGTYYPFT